jgi:hypothetical protein
MCKTIDSDLIFKTMLDTSSLWPDDLILLCPKCNHKSRLEPLNCKACLKLKEFKINKLENKIEKLELQIKEIKNAK